jgi:ERCC4-type nuclease
VKYTFRNKQCLRAVQSGTECVLGKPELKDFLCLRIDSREQAPLVFDSEYVKSERGCVPVFDYALEGDQNQFSLERKSLADFIQSVVLSKSWKRELEKIRKAQERLLPVVYICEFNFDEIRKYDYMQFHSGRVTPQFVYRRIAELIYNLNVHVVFADSREGAAYAICLILKRRSNELVKTSPREEGEK